MTRIVILGTLAACSSPPSSPIAPEPPVDAGPPVSAERDAAPPPVTVPDAGPPPPPAAGGPTTYTERCTIPGDATFYIAEHAFPGRTATDLASVIVLQAPSQTGNPVVASRFTFTRSGSLFVKDGAVGTYCQKDATVTFVDP